MPPPKQLPKYKIPSQVIPQFAPQKTSNKLASMNDKDCETKLTDCSINSINKPQIDHCSVPSEDAKCFTTYTTEKDLITQNQVCYQIRTKIYSKPSVTVQNTRIAPTKKT